MGLRAKDILIQFHTGLAPYCVLSPKERHTLTSCQVYKLYNDPFNLSHRFLIMKLVKYMKLERIGSKTKPYFPNIQIQ